MELRVGIDIDRYTVTKKRYKCPKCGFEHTCEFYNDRCLNDSVFAGPHCPACGAKMDGTPSEIVENKW